MSTQILTVNLTTRRVVSPSSYQVPAMPWGGALTLGLRFVQDTGDGAANPVSLNVESLSALLGAVDAPPRVGSFALHIGNAPAGPTNTTAPLHVDAPAQEFAAAINALAAVTAMYGACTARKVEGSWLFSFANATAAVPVEVVNNTLDPLSMGYVSAVPIDGTWIHELRLRQMPVAATSASDRILPPPPVITRIVAGGSSGYAIWNEVQDLYVPPDFLGAYRIKRGSVFTRVLTVDDGPEEIADALAALEQGFEVTQGLNNHARIEFGGEEMKGSPQDLLEVQALEAPEGDLTFTIDFNTRELLALFRSRATVTLPLVVRLFVRGADEITRPLDVLTLPVTILAPLHFPELETVPGVDWLRQPSPRTYKPFNLSQVITGQQFSSASVGDGVAGSFELTHGLDTEMVFVWVRENTSGGAQLTQGTDYSVTIDSANSVTVTALGDPPAENGWIVTVVSAQTVAAFAEGLTLEIGQVNGLEAILAGIDTRLNVLEEVLPSTGPGATADAVAGLEIELPKTAEVLFLRSALPTGGVTEADLPARAPYMLPAVHAASSASMPSPLPAPAAGNVWLNDSGAAVLVPIGGGIRSAYVQDDGFVASDGRVLYPATRSGSTNSFFPAPFERELFMFAINDRMLRVNRTLSLQFGLSLQLFRATARASWGLVIETGSVPADTDPTPTDPLNLQNVVWTATPALAQRIVLGPLKTTHSFGLRIARAAGGLSCDTMLYGVWEGANAAAPASANFAVRARLINFDTENSITSARGWVHYGIVDPAEGTAKAIIA